MDIEAASGAAVIALIGATVFAFLARCWEAMLRSLSGAGYFADCIMSEAAQRIRHQLATARRRQSILLSSALFFGLAFIAAYLMAPQDFFRGTATWQLVLMLALLLASIAYITYRVTSNFRSLRHLVYVRDAHKAIGHGLQKIAGNMNRVFHDVPCSGRVVDNVLVGLQGVYAIYVVARRPGRKKSVRLRDDCLKFTPGKYQLRVGDFMLRSEHLGRELRKALKHNVRVRTVIAVPGWEIDEQSSEHCLIVNERNLVMLGGWKDRKDYLMNEDVEALHEVLSVRCRR
jgi:hypothetical protein